MDILLVEDYSAYELLIRFALQDQESHRQCRLHVATDADSAWSFLHRSGAYSRARRPDLILLDWNLPGVGGDELLQQIKSDSELCTIPVCVLTNSHSPHDAQAAYQKHANCFVSRPRDLDSFVRMIRGIVDFWTDVATLPPGLPPGPRPRGAPIAA